MALYAIGDIHGCFNALTTLIDSVDLKPQDTLVFLGDYIDRGPASKQVINWIIKHSEKYNTVTLRGNHEVMMLNSRLYQSSLSSWMMNGGFETLDSYEIGDDSDWYKKIPEEHWDFLKATLEYYEKEDFIFVHAGVKPGVELKHQIHDTLFWLHQHEPPPYSNDKIVVCGHTPQKNGQIKNLGHTIFIDTWAFNGQWLTCLDLETGNFVQANEKGETRDGKITIKFSS